MKIIKFLFCDTNCLQTTIIFTQDQVTRKQISVNTGQFRLTDVFVSPVRNCLVTSKLQIKIRRAKSKYRGKRN